MKSKNLKIFMMSLFVMGLYSMVSCKKNLPDIIDYLDPETRFTEKTWSPVLGRTTVLTGNFSYASSSLPLDMKIVNIRRMDGGAPATELTDTFPVKVWKQSYTGLESSLEEIENKRATEYYPLFQLRAHSGNFVMWAASRSSFVLTKPSPGYIFDVEISNSGGLKYERDMVLTPTREVPFEPSTSDPITGVITQPYVNPLTMTNVVGDRTGFELTLKDVQIYFNKNTESSEHAITFKFYDSAYNTINPANFNLTKWETLIHGFDMEKTDTYVRYQVIYPIPAITLVTPYTNSTGDRAHTSIGYQRITSGGFRKEAYIDFDFAIFEEGDWEIAFYFPGEKPRFTND